MIGVACVATVVDTLRKALEMVEELKIEKQLHGLYNHDIVSRDNRVPTWAASSCDKQNTPDIHAFVATFSSDPPYSPIMISTESISCRGVITSLMQHFPSHTSTENKQGILKM